MDALHPFAGQHHLDVAGGTGDVAFRILRAIRAAELEEQAAAAATAGGGPPGRQGPGRGSVTVCDINPAMLDVGRKKAAAAPDLAGGLRAWARGWAEVAARWAAVRHACRGSRATGCGCRR